MLLLAIAFVQLSSMLFQSTNMACWATSNFQESQPLSITVNIPQNASQVFLLTDRGRGDANSVSVRQCTYAQCSTYQNYNAICPRIATTSYGLADVTSVLPKGQYQLTLDSFSSSASTEILSAQVNVSFPIFIYNATDKHCNYTNDKTTCISNIYVSGTGLCFYNSTGNVSIRLSSSNTDPMSVNYSRQNNTVTWNCSNNNYTLSSEFLPLVYSESKYFVDSDLYVQTIAHSLTVFNPNNEAVPDVDFGLNYTSIIAANESKTRDHIYSSQAIQFNTTFSPLFYNFSSAFLTAHLFVTNNASIPFTFNTSRLNFSYLSCEEKLIEINESAEFDVNCLANISHDFFNWTVFNATLVSVDLVTSPTSYGLVVQNTSAVFSKLFSKKISTNDSFAYVNVTRLFLVGQFVEINESMIDGDSVKINVELTANYSINESLIFPIKLDYSRFESIQLASNHSCPGVCIVNKTVSANVSNYLYFTLTAKPFLQPVQPMVESVSTSQSGSSAPIIFSASKLNTSLGDESNQTMLNESDLRETNDDILASTVVNASTDINNNETGEIEPVVSHISGRFTDSVSSFVYAIPILLTIFGLYFLKKQPKRITCVRKNKTTTITVHNFGKTPFVKLILVELLPSGAKSSRKATKTVLGRALQWKKNQLKPAEKWIITYNSSSAAKKGKLAYVCNNKKQEELF